MRHSDVQRALSSVSTLNSDVTELSTVMMVQMRVSTSPDVPHLFVTTGMAQVIFMILIRLTGSVIDPRTPN